MVSAPAEGRKKVRGMWGRGKDLDRVERNRFQGLLSCFASRAILMGFLGTKLFIPANVLTGGASALVYFSGQTCCP